MASLEIIKDGINVTFSKTNDDYLEKFKIGLEKLINDNSAFKEFDGIFNFQIGNQVIFYSYLDSKPVQVERLLVPRQLVDALINEMNQARLKDEL
jgi:hypothetical protein